MEDPVKQLHNVSLVICQWRNL